MIERNLSRRLRAVARKFPAVMITGPRQSGKSTLCRMVFPKRPYVSLEPPDVRAFAAGDPRGFLAQFPRGAIVDEIQRAPELCSFLQGIIDAQPTPGRWILTGSQSLSIAAAVNQSLAGRAAILHLLPLARNETRRFKRFPRTLDAAILTGGYPRILDRRLSPADWLGSYVRSYLDRDVRLISNVGDLAVFQRFVQLCAARTASLLNLSALATDCGVSQPTAKAWLSILEATFIIFRLQPYFASIGKRLVRTPKLHFYDTGLACWLLGIRDASQLHMHPLRGLMFESWVVSEVVKHRASRGEHSGVYFYRDQHGVEADLITENGRELTVIEAKAGQTAHHDLIQAGRNAADALTQARPVRRVVVFGGAPGQRRSEMTLLSWDELDAHRW